MFTNLVLKAKLYKAVIFVCAKETGGGLQPEKLVSYRTGDIQETTSYVLAGKNPHKNIPTCSTLETYKEMPIFISVDITENAVNLVLWKLSRSCGSGGTDFEFLQGFFF